MSGVGRCTPSLVSGKDWKLGRGASRPLTGCTSPSSSARVWVAWVRARGISTPPRTRISACCRAVRACRLNGCEAWQRSRCSGAPPRLAPAGCLRQMVGRLWMSSVRQPDVWLTDCLPARFRSGVPAHSVPSSLNRTTREGPTMTLTAEAHGGCGTRQSFHARRRGRRLQHSKFTPVMAAVDASPTQGRVGGRRRALVPLHMPPARPQSVPPSGRGTGSTSLAVRIRAAPAPAG